MKKHRILFFSLFIALLALCAWLYTQAAFPLRLIAVSWGDGTYGQAHYGAYVYLGEEKDGRIEVKAKIQIGRGTLWTNATYDLGVIGTAQDPIDAVKRWGTLTWKPDGLEIGGEAGNPYLVPRQEFERHR